MVTGERPGACCTFICWPNAGERGLCPRKEPCFELEPLASPVAADVGPPPPPAVFGDVPAWTILVVVAFERFLDRGGGYCSPLASYSCLRCSFSAFVGLPRFLNDCSGGVVV